jgi:hypothetical protein
MGLYNELVAEGNERHLYYGWLMTGYRPTLRVFTEKACRHTEVQQASKTFVDAVAHQRVSLYGQSAIVWDVAGHAQGTHCRAQADTRARPSLTYNSVLI